jgi:hypothetical protein
MKRVMVVILVVIVLMLAVPAVVSADEGKGELPNLLEVISPHLQALLEAVLVAVVPYIAYHVKRWLDEAIQRAKQELTTEQYAMAEIVVRNLVHAAQQIYDQNEGEQKKQYVLEQARQALASYGLCLDLAHLEDLIESMVHQELKAPEYKVLPVE